jgi:hypothetical protein
MCVGIAEVGTWPRLALGPNIAGIGMLHLRDSFNANPWSDLGDKVEMVFDKDREWWVGLSLSSLL